ncbi:hypothetical protein [Maribacter sp. 2304DJ31-5]|uniref:hypothetical protein n=1 Tax=Maribacter sp. 2304DJ31-5 TaxID=3386273 RepID=UPI0039BCC95C
MELAITIFLSILAFYFVMGLLFGLYFIFLGAAKVDPLMCDSKNIVRLLLFPGTIVTWPFLLVKLFKSGTA